MAAFNFFDAFSEHTAEKLHNFDADTLRVYLTNNPPNRALDAFKADLVESVPTGYGYTSGGWDTLNYTSRVNGVTSVIGTNISLTATGGSIGPFRYAVLYNDTAVNDPLIGWWDYGSAITLSDTYTFAVTFGASMFRLLNG